MDPTLMIITIRSSGQFFFFSLMYGGMNKSEAEKLGVFLSGPPYTLPVLRLQCAAAQPRKLAVGWEQELRIT